MSTEKRRGGLLNNIVKVLSANFLVAIVGFASSLFFPKILSIDDYALYQTFTLYLSYITILHLGFPSGMVIRYAGKNYDEIDKSQYKAEIKIIGIVLTFFTVLFLALAGIFKNQMVGYIAIAIIPFCFIGSYRVLLQAWSRFRNYGLLSVAVTTLVPLIGAAVFLINGELSGQTYVRIFLIVYWIVLLIVAIEVFKKISNVKSASIFRKINLDTEKTGIILLLGNYINVLFGSADKQFVKWFFSNTQFAFYSFGISMRALMTVFITSIAQPLFPSMARGSIKDENYNSIKEILIMFGSLSGVAYYVVAFIVKNFIPRYVDSLSVVGIYFVVFPAMAVVSCLYINLYKTKNLIPKYIHTLIGILAISIALNLLFVWLYPEYTGVAIATSVTYYIWFLIGIKQFDFLKLTFADVCYLIIYAFGYFLITKNVGDVLGIVCYLFFIVLLIIIFYRKRLMFLCEYARKRL